MFSHVRSVQAEGARVGFVICSTCGAVVMLDPAEKTDFTKVHETWHAQMRAWSGSTSGPN